MAVFNNLQEISDSVGPGNIWEDSDFSPALQSFADASGYSGDLFGNPYSYTNNTTNEGGDTSYTGQSRYLNSGLVDALKGYQFSPTGPNNLGMYKNGRMLANPDYGAKDSWFDQLAEAAIPMAIGAGFGGGLSGLFGGGIGGNALGYGLSGGGMSVAQGGNFMDGFVGGAIGGGLSGMAQGTPAVAGNNPSAYVPAQPGMSFSSVAGISNPTLAGMFNRGVGTTLGGLATGKSGSEALQSGVLGAGLSGLNSVGTQGMDFISNAFKSLMPDTSQGGLDSLMGSGGDMSGQTDVTPSHYNEFMSGADGMQSYNPSYGFGGDQLPNNFSGGFPQQSIQSAGPSQSDFTSTLGDVGSRMGNYAMNNMGDLASVLYGFYNNRRQQKALGSQMSGLQGLYAPNSPYAQQLRAKLNAQAAAGGRRSNTSGRETQLQAMLADKGASMSPALYQMQQVQQQLQNSNMNMLLQGLNKSGAFGAIGQGLQGMFRPSGSLTGAGSYDAYKNMDNMYGSVG